MEVSSEIGASKWLTHKLNHINCVKWRPAMNLEAKCAENILTIGKSYDKPNGALRTALYLIMMKLD